MPQTTTIRSERPTGGQNTVQLLLQIILVAREKNQPGARGEESEQYNRLRGRDEDEDYYTPTPETSLVEYVPPSAATRPAWFGPVTSTNRTSGGRRVERDRSGANQVYKVCGSTVEGE